VISHATHGFKQKPHSLTYATYVLDQNAIKLHDGFKQSTLQTLIHVDFILLLASSNHLAASLGANNLPQFDESKHVCVELR